MAVNKYNPEEVKRLHAEIQENFALIREQITLSCGRRLLRAKEQLSSEDFQHLLLKMKTPPEEMQRSMQVVLQLSVSQK